MRTKAHDIFDQVLRHDQNDRRVAATKRHWSDGNDRLGAVYITTSDGHRWRFERQGRGLSIYRCAHADSNMPMETAGVWIPGSGWADGSPKMPADRVAKLAARLVSDSDTKEQK